MDRRHKILLNVVLVSFWCLAMAVLLSANHLLELVRCHWRFCRGRAYRWS